jgi:hypothetical protein
MQDVRRELIRHRLWRFTLAVTAQPIAPRWNTSFEHAP